MKRRKRVNLDIAKKILQVQVLNFHLRDNNSRAMPGKRCEKNVALGLKKQKRILTDYLYNLHVKFTS